MHAGRVATFILVTKLSVWCVGSYCVGIMKETDDPIAFQRQGARSTEDLERGDGVATT